VALELYVQRIQLARQALDNRGLALGLVNWSLLISADTPDLAVEACEEALSLDIDEPRIRGHILDAYGVALHRNGDSDGALSAYDRAFDEAERTGDVILRIRILGHLALVLETLGQTERSTAIYEEQRQLAHRAGAKRPEASALDRMSLIFREMGQYDRATACATEALALLKNIKKPDADKIKRRLKEWSAPEID
jgi:tetratricopeptide (TPR) repeat protein